MTSSRRFDRLLQAGCLGLIGTLAVAGCGGSSSGPGKVDAFSPDVIPGDGGPGPVATLTVTPPSLDFGAIEVGAKSAPLTVTVANVGTVTSGPLGVTASGSGIVATGCSGTTLAPKATCTITVTAQMAVAGAITGTIEVGDSAANNKKINISGVAIVQGQFSLAPTPLDLGSVLTGAKTSGTVVMTNAAPTGLTGVVINVSGTGFTAGTGTCTDSLAVGQTCNIVVNFTAGTAGGIAKGTLTVSQGGVTRPVALTATVQAPAKLVMTPKSASFPTVLGTPSTPVTFYVTNAGDVASAVPTVTISGPNKDDFSQTNSCATALAGGATASCQITVVYNPKAAPTTSSTATLTVAEPGTAGSSDTATLTGTAVPKSDLVISGTVTDFGTVIVGTTSAPLTFTLTNIGGDDSGIVKLSTAAPFSFVSDTCTDKNLAAKATCTFTAQFKPTEGDSLPMQGQFKAVGANVANPALFSVTGTAVPQAKLAINTKSLEFGAIPTLEKSPTQTLTITNVGGAPTGALKVENTGAQFNIDGDTCTNAVLTAAGTTSSCTVIVSFTPTGTTVDAAGNIVVSDTTGVAGTVSASLHGTSMARPDVYMEPDVVCSASMMDANEPACATADAIEKFEDKVVGKTSKTVSFKVTNKTKPSTAADSGTLAFAFSGDAAADFAIVQNNCTQPLVSTSADAGTSCVVTVSFTPSAVGVRQAYLTMTTSRGGVDRSTLIAKGLSMVELVPVERDPNADPVVTGLDHGSTPLGVPQTASVTYGVWVRDTTAADHTTTVTVALPTPSQPDFVWPTASNPCSNKTLDLTSTTSPQNGYAKIGSYWYCEFEVLFSPKSAKGALTADLTASATGGGSDKLTLTGRATGPLVVGIGPTSIKPALLADPVAIGSLSTVTLTIVNKGEVAQTGLTFALSGTGAGDFQIVGTDCWGVTGASHHHAYTDLGAVNLEPTESCQVTVGFAPQTESKYTVTFTVTAANGSGTADDESDSVDIIATGLTSLGTLTVTPTVATTQFGDVAEDATNGTVVTFTVTNTGTLPATNLALTALTKFDVLTSVGVAGACSLSDSSYTLAGNTPCTIRVRAKPTADANGTQKTVVEENLAVSANFGGQTIGVTVPMLYYVTSNIVVRDTGASSTTIAYAFPAAGVEATQTHSFVVTNIGTSAADLDASVAAPYSVVETPEGTLNPPACSYAANGLAVGASCTLVVQNINTTGSSDAATLLTIKDNGKGGAATVSLTKSTLGNSKLVLKYLETTPSISLGSVPADSTTANFTGGKATIWYKNEGGIPTAALNFRWGTGTAGVADPEFIIDSDETNCVGKVLQPGALCAMNIHFKYDTVGIPALGLRTRVLNVLDGTQTPNADYQVELTATATATNSLRIEDTASPVRTGFYQFTGATLKDEESAPRTLRITNSTGASQAFTMPALTGDFVYAGTQPATGACGVAGAAVTLDPATTTTCSFNVAFKPTTDSPFYKHDAIAITGTSANASIGLMGKVRQPVTLEIAGTESFGVVGGGSTVARSFTVTNMGDVGMAADQVSLTTALGAQPAAASYAITADTCNGARLAAGASCVITVTVTGGAFNAAAQTNTLTVSNAYYLTSALTRALTVSTKDAATLSVSPTVKAFGQVPVTGYAEETFTVSNGANSVVSGVVEASLSGAGAAQFSILSSTCSTGLAASGTCQVKVRFSPTALVADNQDVVAVLSLTAAPGGTKTVNLSGTPVSALTISPVGPVTLGASALQVFTVTLGSTATATTSLKTKLEGADFMIVADDCYARVLSTADASCTISVKYTGTTSPTTKSATLTVNGGSAVKTASAVINATSIQAAN